MVKMTKFGKARKGISFNMILGHSEDVRNMRTVEFLFDVSCKVITLTRQVVNVEQGIMYVCMPLYKDKIAGYSLTYMLKPKCYTYYHSCTKAGHPGTCISLSNLEDFIYLRHTHSNNG